MKVITTNLLNRFWKNGVKPIKDALTSKVNTSDIINNLTTTVSGKALDARQGKALSDKLATFNSTLSNDISELNRNMEGLGTTYETDAYNGTTNDTLYTMGDFTISHPGTYLLNFSGYTSGQYGIYIKEFDSFLRLGEIRLLTVTGQQGITIAPGTSNTVEWVNVKVTAIKIFN